MGQEIFMTSGLGSIADKARPQVASVLYGIITLAIIGVVGLMGNLITSFSDNVKMAKILNRVTLISAYGIFLGMGIMFIVNIVDELYKLYS
ncbi:hypothetical protein [Dendrosporobacter sp. 1207_IL3150]|uniref:hypothetical protein n=1 Tax=Dendrosporobacter sp. 1207_IL3150 TaxID=3084054 RepID=UPI002FD892B3